jgi:ribosomal protein S18 acetylase RimI-like enzyme
VEIRAVRADEWRRWREVRLRMLRDDATFFATRYEDVVREPDEHWKAWVTEAETGVTKALFVAEGDEGQWLGVVGAFVRVNPSEVHLVSMWVDPEARGLGVARSLIQAVGSWAQGRGASKVLLFVQESNGPARALYERAGFTATGDRASIGAGRVGFKVMLAAEVENLLL